MRARYMFATGRVKFRELPQAGDISPTHILTTVSDPAGRTREARLCVTSDYYNGALVYREDGAP